MYHFSLYSIISPPQCVKSGKQKLCLEHSTFFFFVYISLYFREILEYFVPYCVSVSISLTNPSIHTCIYNKSVYIPLVNICLGLMLISQYMQFSGSIFIFKD